MFLNVDARGSGYASVCPLLLLLLIETESAAPPAGPRKQRVVLVLDYQFNGCTQSAKIIKDRPNKMLFCFLNT